MRWSPGVLLATLVLVSCGGDGSAEPVGDASGVDSSPASHVRDVVEVTVIEDGGCPEDTTTADFPDVVGAAFAPVEGDQDVWDVAVTICSLYDTPERYADAWRVATPAGEVLATRELLHDHAGEQPFTRSLTEPVTVPDDVSTVVVEARDLTNGWGGGRLEVDLG